MSPQIVSDPTRGPSPATGLGAVLLAGAGIATAARLRAVGGALDTRDLTGRTALVTGGGSGIGRALALLLGERGATVHVVDRVSSSAEAVAQQIGAGGRARSHVVDVSDAAAVAALADRVLAEGPVDLLCNNAGIGHAGAVADTPLEDWRRLIEVNILGVVHGVHAFLPRLLQQAGAAHILNTASLAGLTPTPGLVPYSTTKAAIVGLSDALDIELAGTNVRVSALCPGIIDTDIVRAATMRGQWAERRATAVERYAQRGTSAETVARQALDGIRQGRAVIASPRWQVLPAWLLKRASPGASRMASRALVRAVSGAAGP